jgi:hypothetical protein
MGCDFYICVCLEIQHITPTKKKNETKYIYDLYIL